MISTNVEGLFILLLASGNTKRGRAGRRGDMFDSTRQLTAVLLTGLDYSSGFAGV